MVAAAHTGSLGAGEERLRDGSVVLLREIQPSDADALIRFHEALSPESIRMRYFSAHPHLSAVETTRLTTVDHRDRQAYVAVVGDEIIGVGRYERNGSTDEAEVAFPFSGLVELEDPETTASLEVDADSYRRDYLHEIEQFRETYRRECFQSGIDYVPLDTSMPFDRALMEYLLMRQSRG